MFDVTIAHNSKWTLHPRACCFGLLAADFRVPWIITVKSWHSIISPMELPFSSHITFPYYSHFLARVSLVAKLSFSLLFIWTRAYIVPTQIILRYKSHSVSYFSFHTKFGGLFIYLTIWNLATIFNCFILFYPTKILWFASLVPWWWAPRVIPSPWYLRNWCNRQAQMYSLWTLVMISQNVWPELGLLGHTFFPQGTTKLLSRITEPVHSPATAVFFLHPYQHLVYWNL